MQCMENLAEIRHLGLDTEPLVPLLGDGQLDTLALGQRDERLVPLQDENIKKGCHKREHKIL